MYIKVHNKALHQAAISLRYIAAGEFYRYAWRTMKKIFLVSALLALLTPIAAWAIYKPVRVLAPEWVGVVVCVNSEICIEDKSKYQEAENLFREAIHDVSLAVGGFHHKPRVIFCSTENCYRSFGFEKASATNVGTSGIVISPRGWKLFYLRHEMIHHRQVEEFGLLSSLFKPEWLTEGMAYSLSGDPRKPLAERWQKARGTFDRWLKTVGVGVDNLWKEARNI